ncbi:MAG: extracellular solute-binding protein [Chloroflexi bacterium]|nr:extracellular solute-binding protein [Chloroflexota bacterium]
MFSEKLSRRQFVSGVAIAAAGMALAACAPKATPTPEAKPAQQPTAAPAQPTPAPAKKEPVTIRFMSRAGATNLPTYEKVIKERFETEHPDIKVQIEPAPDGWVEKLLAQMIAGTAVDLFQAWGNIFYNWTERGLLLDVQPYVDSTMTDAEIADYNEFQWEGLFMKGIRVGMPKYINIMTLTCNVEMWDEYGVPLPPEDGNYDHDDYTEWMATLTENARSKGNNNVWAGWLPAWSWDRFWNHIHMFDGKIVDQKYGKVCMMDQPEAQAALKWMYDMEWTWNYHAQPAQVENKWFRQAMNAKLVMTCESGTYPINSDRDFQEAGIKWDMRHVPKGPTGKRSVLGTTDAWSITKQTKYPDQSWELLHFLSGPVFQLEAVVKQEGIIPVLKSLVKDFIKIVREVQPTLNDVRLETISEVLEWGYAEDTPWFCNQTEAVDLIRPALEKVFTTGDADHTYFIEVAKQVTESQKDCTP